jgi:predicted dehydrogenase
MMDRRSFFQSSAAALAASQFGQLIGDTKTKRVALIGSGWYGKCDLFRLMQVAPVDVVGLCDVDKNMLAGAIDLVAAKQNGRKPRGYADYKELLKQEKPEITIIGTPDHWHALPLIETVKAGSDVYLQKPIGIDIIEGQAMLNAARKYKRVVQVGTQRRSTPHLIEARNRVIKDGKLGKVSHAEIYCYYHMRSKSTAPDTAAPAHLDWEAYTGPAPMRAYNPIVHPRGWRAFMEYGNGIVGDMCIHMLDTVRWMLDLGWSTEVHSLGGIYQDKTSRANITDTQTATFKFPELDIVWTHRSWGTPPDPQYPWGLTLYGERGTLRASVNRFDFVSLDGKEKLSGEALMEFEKYPEDRTEKDLERHVASAIRGHMRDLVTCIESREKPVADIEQGHMSTTACVLANMSMKLGRSLKWDPATHTVIGDKEATQMLAREYRKGYKHPNPKDV